MNCKQCDVKVDDHRARLGYSECTDCSTVVKYSAHTVYPHKTGGYVQPVTSDQSEDLKRLDRRSVRGMKTARGQWASGSWDQWLKQYWKDKYNPKPQRTVTYVPIIENKLMTNNELRDIINEEYNKSGYYRACEKLQSLFQDDEITLIQKSTYMNQLAQIQVLPKKIRKTVALR